MKNIIPIIISYLLAIFLLSEFSFYGQIAITLFLFNCYVLFRNAGNSFLVREIAGVLFCLQFLVGPAIFYNGGEDAYGNSTITMGVSEEIYMSFAIFSIIAFLSGLYFFNPKLLLDDYKIKLKKILIFNPKLSLILFSVGLFAQILKGLNSFTDLTFLIYLLQGLTFAGGFLALFNVVKPKFTYLSIAIALVTAEAISLAMFHDFLIWVIVSGAFISIIIKPNFTQKIVAGLFIIFLAVIIQSVKVDYRALTSGSSEVNRGVGNIENAAKEVKQGDGFFTEESLVKQVIRINQGWIVSNAMATVPSKIQYSYGEELLDVLVAAFFPRFLFPNKLKSGDTELVMKYTGLTIREGTTFALSCLGDAYVNFGKWGGVLFMFFYGIFVSWIYKIMIKKSKKSPLIILFIPLLFHHFIRPDTELQTALGHLIKSTFLIYAVIWILNEYNNRNLSNPKISTE